ncbi:MAG: CvpA family protein [bacterium]
MDPVLLIPLPFILILGLVGFREGVVKRVLEIAGLIATIILTARFAAAVQPWVMDRTGAGQGPALLITWAVLFFAGLILSRFLASLVSKLIRLTVLGWVDRLGGALAGMVMGAFLASVVVILLTQAPGGRSLEATYLEDPVGRMIYGAAPGLYQQARTLFGARADEVWTRVMDEARERAAAAAERAGEAVGGKIEEQKERLEEKAKEAVQ